MAAGPPRGEGGTGAGPAGPTPLVGTGGWWAVRRRVRRGRVRAEREEKGLGGELCVEDVRRAGGRD